MTMMTMMTVIDNVVDHYTYQTRWGQKRTHAKIHPELVCKYTGLLSHGGCVMGLGKDLNIYIYAK